MGINHSENYRKDLLSESQRNAISRTDETTDIMSLGFNYALIIQKFLLHLSNLAAHNKTEEQGIPVSIKLILDEMKDVWRGIEEIRNNIVKINPFFDFNSVDAEKRQLSWHAFSRSIIPFICYFGDLRTIKDDRMLGKMVTRKILAMLLAEHIKTLGEDALNISEELENLTKQEFSDILRKAKKFLHSDLRTEVMTELVREIASTIEAAQRKFIEKKSKTGVYSRNFHLLCEAVFRSNNMYNFLQAFRVIMEDTNID